MKKILGLLLVSSSIFSMQLAYKLQTPHKRFSRVTSALIKANKLQVPYAVSKSEPMVSHEIDAKKVRIDPSSVHVPHNLSGVELYHSDKGFCVYQNDKKYKIGKYFTDPIVRNATSEQLHRFLEHGYLIVKRTNDGEFRLQANERVVGGGVGGATAGFYIGKFVTYFVCHGAIVIVSALSGPAAPATFAGLEACLAPHIELASQATSLAGGMIGAVATGPV